MGDFMVGATFIQEEAKMTLIEVMKSRLMMAKEWDDFLLHHAEPSFVSPELLAW